MDTTASAVAPFARSGPRGRTPAAVVLGGALLSLIGLTWDIQWHNDVGPDTFFPLPHLFLYAGSAVSGLASLVVVLAATAAQHGGRTVDPIVGGPAVGVLGRTFAAPVGYLISGSGAALFLLYGLWDQWWHGLYGFDATIASPPHIGFLLSVTITMAGSVTVFTAARRHRWGRIGAIVGTATLVAFGVVVVVALEELPMGPVDPADVGAAFICVLAVMMCARALEQPGGALAVTVVIAAMQAALWWFDPWAAEAYARSVGLPLREYTDGVPMHPAMIPMVLVVVGALMEMLRRRPAWSTGALGGAVLGLCAPLQRTWLYDTGAPGLSGVLITAATAAGFGALAGFLGARIGELLGQLTPKKETQHA
ncbi:hypothetical protein ABZ729_19645 [Streptomyces sp. NPDC006678]|uniref:hypothetical protein n=1 Tax=Streptomyces sp. NPDC006678 TaxID=3157185 RepID=UPI0033F73B7F